MSEMSISSAPAPIVTAPSAPTVSAAPAAQAPVFAGALSGASATVDMRGSASPMQLAVNTPKMIKV